MRANEELDFYKTVERLISFDEFAKATWKIYKEVYGDKFVGVGVDKEKDALYFDSLRMYTESLLHDAYYEVGVYPDYNDEELMEIGR